MSTEAEMTIAECVKMLMAEFIRQHHINRLFIHDARLLEDKCISLESSNNELARKVAELEGIVLELQNKTVALVKSAIFIPDCSHPSREMPDYVPDDVSWVPLDESIMSPPFFFQMSDLDV